MQRRQQRLKKSLMMISGKHASLVAGLMPIMLISGCSSTDLNSVMNGNYGASGFSSNASISDVAGSTVDAVAQMILPFYKAFDPYALWIAMASFIIGCGMIFFFHNSKAMTKWAIFSFMILIPTIMIAFDIGVGAWLSNCLY